LARAYTSYSDALDYLITCSLAGAVCFPKPLAAVLATGATGPLLDHALADLIDTEYADDTETRERLIALTPPMSFAHLRTALSRLRVTHCSHLAKP
jgi:hypothetical protein